MVPVTYGATTDFRRHSSRADGFDRCSSTFTPSYAANASASAYYEWVNAPGFITIATHRPRAAWIASMSSPSWFDWKCSSV